MTRGHCGAAAVVLWWFCGACVPADAVPEVIDEAGQSGGDSAATTPAFSDGAPCPVTQPVCACDEATVTFDAIEDRLPPARSGGNAYYYWAVFDLSGASVEEVVCQGTADESAVHGGSGTVVAGGQVSLPLTEYPGLGFYLGVRDATGVFGRAAAEIGADPTVTEVAVELSLPASDVR